MKAPQKEVIDSTIGQFIERTSNAVLAVWVCVVCAHETDCTEISLQPLDSIPSPCHLQPIAVHPHHNIYNRMLLHTTGLTDNRHVSMYMECLRALNSDKIPMFALANGMWIGEIPHELAYFTLPE